MRCASTHRGTLWVAALLAVSSLLGGCARGRVVVVETVPETSVTTRVDSAVVPTPRWAALPAAGMRLSFPEAVRRYETALKTRAGLEVVEIELRDGRAVVRGRGGETVHRLPPQGERKVIRPDRAGGMHEYVAGAPVPERVEVPYPEEPGFVGRFAAVVWGLAVVVGLLLIVGVLACVRRLVG